MKGYHLANMSLWHGRIDSVDDYDSFRWHQIIEMIDITNLDYNQNKLNFIIIGYQIDEGIRLNKGRVGASAGPNKVREFLCNKSCSFENNIRLYDGGNITLVDSVENAQETLALLVNKCLENNYFPIVIGGGHDVSYGSMSGLLKYFDFKKEMIGLINFDAHFDARPYTQSTSGTMFAQIYDNIMDCDGLFNHFTIGIQKSANTTSLFKFAESVNSRYLLANELTSERKILNDYLVDEFISKQDHLYVTICSDVFASPYAPGVSSPQTLGISPEYFLEQFKHILDSNKVVAFDIAEISPELDRSNTTASLGALIIYTLVNHLASL